MTLNIEFDNRKVKVKVIVGWGNGNASISVDPVNDHGGINGDVNVDWGYGGTHVDWGNGGVNVNIF